MQFLFLVNFVMGNRLAINPLVIIIQSQISPTFPTFLSQIGSINDKPNKINNITKVGLKKIFRNRNVVWVTNPLKRWKGENLASFILSGFLAGLSFKN